AGGQADRVGRGGVRGPSGSRLLLLGALGRVAGHSLALALLARLLGLRAPTRPDTWHPGDAAALGQVLHHLPRLEEPLDELVHLGDVDTGAARDPGSARPVDDLGLRALARRHRLDDRLDPVDLTLVEVGQLV